MRFLRDGRRRCCGGRSRIYIIIIKDVRGGVPVLRAPVVHRRSVTVIGQSYESLLLQSLRAVRRCYNNIIIQ